VPHPFEALADELVARILVELDTASIKNMVAASKTALTVSCDRHFRLVVNWNGTVDRFDRGAQYICRHYPKEDRLFELVARPLLCNDTTIDCFLESEQVRGDAPSPTTVEPVQAHFSCYFVQLVTLARAGLCPRWLGQRWAAKLPMSAYVKFTNLAFQRYGEFSTHSTGTDGNLVDDWIRSNGHRAVPGWRRNGVRRTAEAQDEAWETIEQVFKSAVAHLSSRSICDPGRDSSWRQRKIQLERDSAALSRPSPSCVSWARAQAGQH
jgi:hypothetical protein